MTIFDDRFVNLNPYPFLFYILLFLPSSYLIVRKNAIYMSPATLPLHWPFGALQAPHGTREDGSLPRSPLLGGGQ
jgi:hypothetical protein